MAAAHRNICVVGDADQSIYRFRGANIGNILSFQDDYPDAKVIRLEENYRSSGNILRAANAVIEHNLDRLEKRLFTRKPAGERILIYRAQDERTEAAFVAGQIEERARAGGAPQDVAILYRTHAQSRAFEEEFIRRGIAYRIVAGLRFYERKEVKDILAYLRLVANPADTFSLQRIINVPRRGIGETTMSRLAQFAEAEGIRLMDAMRRVDEIEAIGPAYRGRVRSFVEWFDGVSESAARMSVTELTEEILRSSGYMAELQAERSIEAQTRIENLQELLTVTQQFELEAEAAGEEASLESFLEHVALISDVDAFDPDADAVTMMTLHAAKGLEFPVVFIVGMEEGIFPSARTNWDPSELEEERRLCYVGITRAMEYLFLTSAAQRTLYGSTNFTQVSRFIDEIPEELKRDLNAEIEEAAARIREQARQRRERMSRRRSRHGAAARAESDGGQVPQFRAGERVRHSTWGEGLVVSVEGSGEKTVISVAFPDQGIKKLMASMAPIERC